MIDILLQNSIISSIPSAYAFTKTKFIFYTENNLCIYDLVKNTILKYKYEKITNLTIYKNFLFLASKDIYILDLEKFEIQEIIRISKSEIIEMKILNDKIIISLLDRRVLLYEILNISVEVSEDVSKNLSEDVSKNLSVDDQSKNYQSKNFSNTDQSKNFSKTCKSKNYRFNLLFSFNTPSVPERIFITEKYFGYKGNDNIRLYNYNLRIFIDLEKEVSDLIFIEDKIYSIFENKIEIISSENNLGNNDMNNSIENNGMNNLDNNGMNNLDNNGCLDLDFNISCFFQNDQFIYFSDGFEIIKFDKNFMISNSTINNSTFIKNSTIKNFKKIDQIKFSDLIYQFNKNENSKKHKSDLNDISLVNGNNISLSNKIVFFNDSFILTSDSDFILHSNFEIYKIFMFNESVTNSVLINETLFISTASGCIKYGPAFNNSALFSGNMIFVDDSTITSMKNLNNNINSNINIKSNSNINNNSNNIKNTNFIVLGTKNGKVKLFSNLNLIWSVQLNNSVTAVDIFENSNNLIIAVGTILGELYKYVIDKEKYKKVIDKDFKGNNVLNDQSANHNDQSVNHNHENSLFNQNFKLIPHSKQINYISITDKFIISSSSDKSCKIFDFDGILLNSIISDKIISTNFNDKYLLIFSHKSFRIHDIKTFNVIKVFSTKKAILSSYIFDINDNKNDNNDMSNNDNMSNNKLYKPDSINNVFSHFKTYFICISDIIRIYNLEKCVASFDFSISNAWSFSYPIICAENSIIRICIKNFTKNFDKLKKKFIVENDYLSLFKNESDFRKKFNIIKNYLKNINDNKNMNYFNNVNDNQNMNDNNLVNQINLDDIIKECNDFGLLLSKNGQLKDSQIFNFLINSYFKKIDKKFLSEIEKICEKQESVVENLIIEMESANFYS